MNIAVLQATSQNEKKQINIFGSKEICLGIGYL